MGLGYSLVARPLLALMDSEKAHSRALLGLRLSSATMVGRMFLRLLYKPKNGESNLFSLNFPNPLGLAAGMDKKAESMTGWETLGFGFIEVGTITPKPQFGNPKPRVFRLQEDEALINRLGFNNVGSDSAASNIRNNSPKGLLGINIGPNKETKNRIEDYLECFRVLNNLGDYITINISFPNTENLRSFHNPNELEELLNVLNEEKNKTNSNTSIAVKIAPDLNTKDLDIIGNILLKYNIKLVIISNSSDRTRDNLKNINKFEKGGLSGKPIEEKSNLLIKEFYKIFTNKIKIIGVGGVDSGKSALEKLISGASYIQLYTGMVYQGPNIIKKIKNELKIILTKKRITNFEQIIGKNNN